MGESDLHRISSVLWGVSVFRFGGEGGGVVGSIGLSFSEGRCCGEYRSFVLRGAVLWGVSVFHFERGSLTKD